MPYKRTYSMQAIDSKTGILIVVLALVITGCSENGTSSSDKIRGSGNLITDTRTVAAFESVSFEGVGDVNVTQGASQSVEITVDDNINQYIETSVVNGTLVIETDDDVELEDFDLTVEIVLPDVDELHFLGVGDLSSRNTLDVDELTVSMVGVGNVDLSVTVDELETEVTGVGNIMYDGSAREHDVLMTSVGNLLAFDLETDETMINLTGSGSAQVHAADQLTVTLTGSGNISYRGTPTISVSITGAGQLIDAN